MKKILLMVLLVAALGSAVAGWLFLGPATNFNEPKKTLYISSKAPTKKAVVDSLTKNHLIKNEGSFAWLANQMDYWQKIKPGRYDIKKGSSLLKILRMLRNGQQTPVNLVITKLRTKADFARLVGNKFESDSLEMIQFLNNNDSLKFFDKTSEIAMTAVLPDTYRFFWNTSSKKIYEKLVEEEKKFWDENRIQKATTLGLMPAQVYILASIVEEETTNNEEKDTIASVYLNRLQSGNKLLQADPTVKFAIGDFSIKWIHGDILNTDSPYNTYKYPGLPPGPICTPSKRTIDEVLNPAKTKYLFFVANSKLNGHSFSETFEEHRKKANQYREEDKLRRESQTK